MKQYLFSLFLLCFLPLACSSSDSLNQTTDSIKLIDLEGKTHSLNQYKGKWVLINYWATWCPPCLKEIPHLIDATQLLDNVVVFGVNSEKISKERLQQFVKGQMITYPIFMLQGNYQDPTQLKAFTNTYNIPRGLPTTYIINPQGLLVKRHQGGINIDQIEQLIK